jgi:Ribose/Galactose Isomerase
MQDSKEEVKAFLTKENHDVLDVGTTSKDPVDYPDYAQAVGEALREVPSRARHYPLRQRRRRIDGMGGSSLCPEVMKMTFGKISGFPELHVLDSTDPAQVKTFENKSI